ncbi:phosphate/phosphite/phosphonate ABC transporter substrate-binding protein [Actimicrobium sp. CCC2.4]|uniref:phosphate/phosphite/phosphonate ABC transporter substrate-binding protein n=1 Tax=Actimicrobium sp. CCC2.4 TaxID=3048606 RepID=UPI002AC938E3|nr:phosphate/phosphite/phosphonate ABC transporter substrate-binding protein [Actimicrobium sp. CCC2.4]MEB0136516.1 phosphate/phosphite/phosphonate ABC transporter substrate-binding protein [Actimicrobium sp. CCC2.4]WPX30877.1 phosphate/phosphite/phosphonate ABC transporter substrate-binding protein [Actimicrobium sp. CCC2.4]
MPVNRHWWGSAVVLLAVLASALPGLAADCERPVRLRYSMVPEGDVKSDLARFRPLLDRLQATLGMPVEVVTPASYGAVIEGLLAGAVDLARLGPSSYLSARKADPAIIPFATFSQPTGAFQPAGPFYQSLLIVRADGPLKQPASLRGVSLALVDPDSTSGNKVPRYFYSQVMRMSLENWFGRVSYAGTHTGAVAAVMDGRASAAFVSSFQLSTMSNEGKLRPQDVRVLWRSAPLPMDPFVYRGTLCPDITDKIRAVFLGRHGLTEAPVLDGMNAIRFLPIQDRDYRVLDELR